MCQGISDTEPSNGIKIAILLGYITLFIAGSLLVFAKKSLKEGGSNGNGLISATELKKSFSAFQNIKAKALALGVKYTNDDIYKLLELVGLQDTGKKDVRAFSMGMKQRLGIAMALVGEPDLLILDEPINRLDPQGILEIRNLLEKIHKEQGVTMVISSHILDELAKTATRFCVLNKGGIIKNCTKEEFLSECGDKDISEYYLQLIQCS